MAGIVNRGFDQPDETRTPDKTRADVVNVGQLRQILIIGRLGAARTTPGTQRPRLTESPRGAGS